MSEEVQVGGYRRINVVQTGQNSEVWEAVEIAGGMKRFAMKLLLPEKASDPDQRQMLKHEAEVGLKLVHPKIIRFYKYVRHRDHPFILMENFPAPNLKLRLMRGQFQSFIKPRLRSILQQVGSALYVHEKGWVHRDIKPDNVLINAQGDVRLIDFALAVRTAGTFARRFGKRGRTAGTRSYMSPEQIYGYPLDGRADIYSFGVLLYEVVSGRLPFTGNTANMLLRKHITDPAPPIESDRKLMPQFELLIYQMLAKKPDDRPKSVDEILAKLRLMRKLFKDDPDNPEVEQQTMSKLYQLPFERPIYELEAKLNELEAQSSGQFGVSEEVRRMRRELENLTRKIYDNLSAWQTVTVARHPNRPQSSDYFELIFEEMVELHGDRAFGDDRAIVTGLAKLGDYKVLVVGHQKGRHLKERQERLFGCAHPEGYRKALAKMRFAAKYRLPVICMIDTPGAYPGIGAEERGQAQMIATNLMEMFGLPTPIICTVIGEGGSGGALGIGVGDRIAMLQYAYYSVISPEGCSGILWKDGDKHKEEASECLKLTSRDLSRLGVIDDVVVEPLGAAHRDHRTAAGNLKALWLRYLRELTPLPTEKLLRLRHEKFRKMGEFIEAAM